METSTILWLFVAAFGASALGGVLGMASGIFIVPILTLLFGVDIHVAIGASIVSVIACSCGSAASFLKGRLTNIRLAIVLETATTLGALTGVFLIRVVSTSFLYGLFAFILAVSAKQMLARRREAIDANMPGAGSWATVLRLHSSFPDHVPGRHVSYQVRRVPLGLSLMYISALLGIGSGVLKIPAMDTALRLPIKVSSATSNFMIGVPAAASAGAYFVRGDIDIGIAGPVALGSVVGALVGARLLMVLPAPTSFAFFFHCPCAARCPDVPERLGRACSLGSGMKPMIDSYERHEQIIAALLWQGSWLASAVIAAGMALGALPQLEGLPGFSLSGYDIVKAGVALFILLPVARVALMLAIFLHERDYAYTMISALVLAITGAGILIGL